MELEQCPICGGALYNYGGAEGICCEDCGESFGGNDDDDDDEF